MTELEEKLKRQIALHGPISIASYMAQCLCDPDHGYYTKRDPFGSEGDYTTAPEVSQMFGELIGIWFLSLWQQQGRPKPFHLAELGPGRGTLMADMLRVILPHLQGTENLHIHLVEISPFLKQIQKGKLVPFNIEVTWHDDLTTLPQSPLFIIGNEFFDALPIHQWVAHQQRWHERVVGLDENGELAFGLGPVRDLASPDHLPIDEGAIREQSPTSEAIVIGLTRHLAKHSGAALLIDYGYDRPAYGNTFQALQSNAYADPLRQCGERDLTAHVNFHALTEAAKGELAKTKNGLSISRTVTQGDFLLRMGLLERAGQLGSGKSTNKQNEIRAAVERLAAPEEMGALFKLFAIYPQAIAAPAFSELT